MVSKPDFQSLICTITLICTYEAHFVNITLYIESSELKIFSVGFLASKFIHRNPDLKPTEINGKPVQ